MIAEETTSNTAFNSQPKKFVTWLFVLSSLMCFAGLTSAYIVRKAEGNWKIFDLPQAFYYTTVLILLSSITLHLSLTNAKKGQIAKQKNYLVITIILGLGFLFGQYFAWKQLVANGIYFAGNPAESFLYVISGFHAFHIIAGIMLLLFALTGTFSKINQTKNIFRMEISTIFWHFIDILWIYLLVFLLINR